MKPLDQRRLQACRSNKQRVIELFRQGYSHDDIVITLRRSLTEVRRIISAATADDPELYMRHRAGRV